jgi:copper(I)-binding protein
MALPIIKTAKILLTVTLLLSSGLSFAKGISVDDPYVREVPPGVPTSATFLMLKNDSDKDIALIKATSDVAKNVELHEHVHDNGMMKMRQIPKISIPANGTTVLKPGGYHIMLIGLTRKIKSGDVIDLALEFDDGSKKSVKAEVKKVLKGMMGGMKKGAKDMKLKVL